MQVSHGLLPMDSESWKQQESITEQKSITNVRFGGVSF